MKLHYLLLGVLLAFTVPVLKAQVIIWDLGGVLFKTNRFGVGRSVGLFNFMSYCLFDWKSPKIEPLLFDVLDMMDTPPLPDSTRAYTGEGVLLPTIMCHWQAGTISGPEIVSRSRSHIEHLYRSGYFISRRERRLVEKTIHTMFDPYTLAYNMSPIKQGLRLLMECAHEMHENGTPKNYLIALSNWDTLSFDIFHELYYALFSHFDKLVISGDTGLIKPRKAAFMQLITSNKLKPHECLFIDDQLVNIEAAKQCGFQTFHVHNGNYRELRRTLVKLGALPF